MKKVILMSAILVLIWSTNCNAEVIDEAVLKVEGTTIKGPISLLSDPQIRAWLEAFCKERDVVFLYVGKDHMCIGIEDAGDVQMGDFHWKSADVMNEWNRYRSQ